jgi:hypothetical protein
MMEPAPKAAAITNLLDKLGGRTEAIKNHRCIKKPLGCGRLINIEEFGTWRPIDLAEYTISGLCVTCQAEIFKEPEDPERPMLDNLVDLYPQSDNYEREHYSMTDPDPRDPFYRRDDREEWG